MRPEEQRAAAAHLRRAQHAIQAIENLFADPTGVNLYRADKWANLMKREIQAARRIRIAADARAREEIQA